MNRHPASTNPCRTFPTRRRGYVLVLTLVVILLAGLITAGLARQSLRLALEANAAQEELQERWGRFSIERAVRSTEFLRRRSRPKHSLTATVRLGTESLAVELTEENAKLNLNALLRERGQADVEQALRHFGPADLPRRLSQMEAPRDQRGLDRIESWGQVFELSALDSRRSATLVQRASRRLTLWGDGRLNLDTADPDLVRELCGGRLGVRALRDLREQRELQPQETLEQALEHVALSLEERRALLRLLTTRSTGWGLWVTSRRSIEFCAWDESQPRSPPVRCRW